MRIHIYWQDEENVEEARRYKLSFPPYLRNTITPTPHTRSELVHPSDQKHNDRILSSPALHFPPAGRMCRDSPRVRALLRHRHQMRIGRRYTGPELYHGGAAGSRTVAAAESGRSTQRRAYSTVQCSAAGYIFFFNYPCLLFSFYLYLSFNTYKYKSKYYLPI